MHLGVRGRMPCTQRHGNPDCRIYPRLEPLPRYTTHHTMDRAYDNVLLTAFCDDTETKLILAAANDNEANGLIENANRKLRSL